MRLKPTHVLVVAIIAGARSAGAVTIAHRAPAGGPFPAISGSQAQAAQALLRAAPSPAGPAGQPLLKTLLDAPASDPWVRDCLAPIHAAAAEIAAKKGDAAALVSRATALIEARLAQAAAAAAAETVTVESLSQTAAELETLSQLVFIFNPSRSEEALQALLGARRRLADLNAAEVAGQVSRTEAQLDGLRAQELAPTLAPVAGGARPGAAETAPPQGRLLRPQAPQRAGARPPPPIGERPGLLERVPRAGWLAIKAFGGIAAFVLTAAQGASLLLPLLVTAVNLLYPPVKNAPVDAALLFGVLAALAVLPLVAPAALVTPAMASLAVVYLAMLVVSFMVNELQ
ncbi:MAG: hypothetical protein HY554_02410 [Elusimicrobia bacterium]|nr:hypothetical protein [Elusimicrobiota bacterium]